MFSGVDLDDVILHAAGAPVSRSVRLGPASEGVQGVTAPEIPERHGVSSDLTGESRVEELDGSLPASVSI